jgi:putative transposase
MNRTVSPSVKRAYGLSRACRTWRLSRATIWRHGRAADLPAAPRRRPGPQGPMSDDAPASEIRALLAASPLHGEGYRKVWARLRVWGTRTSPRRVLRVMRENDLLAHQRSGAARGPRAHDGTITTGKVDEMSGTDLTSVMTGEGSAAVFVAVDHCSAECVGIHASHRATRFEALDTMMRTLLYEAAQVLLTRVSKWSWLKAWAMAVVRRRGLRRVIVALARRLAVIMHRMWRDGTDFRWTRCAGQTG